MSEPFREAFGSSPGGTGGDSGTSQPFFSLVSVVLGVSFGSSSFSSLLSFSFFFGEPSLRLIFFSFLAFLLSFALERDLDLDLDLLRRFSDLEAVRSFSGLGDRFLLRGGGDLSGLFCSGLFWRRSLSLLLMLWLTTAEEEADDEEGDSTPLLRTILRVKRVGERDLLRGEARLSSSCSSSSLVLLLFLLSSICLRSTLGTTGSCWSCSLLRCLERLLPRPLRLFLRVMAATGK